MTKPLSVLILCAWFPTGPFRFISEAFERMGARVFRAGPTYNDHAGIDWGKDVIEPDLPFFREGEEWSLDQVIGAAAHVGFMPDFLLLGEENYQTHITPTTKIPVAYYTLDGWPNCFARGDALNPQAKFTNQPGGIRIHPRVEDLSWEYLPGAAAPWVHKDLGLNRDLDFCLLSASYGYRRPLCEYLEKNGYAVRYGLTATPPYVETYNRSKFTYCNVNGNAGEAKWRGFEAMAMGCVNIIDEGPNLFNRLGYFPGEHYVPVKVRWQENGEPWPDGSDLEEALGSSLHDTDCFFETSKKAREKVLAQDTYYNRANQVLASLGFDELEIPGES